MRLTYCCIVALIFIIAKYLFNPFASEFRFIILSIIAFYLPYFLIFRDGSIDNFICEFNNKVDIVYWEYKGEKSSFDFERKIVQAFLLDEDVNSISTKFEYSSRLVIKTLKKYHCLPEDYDDFNK